METLVTLRPTPLPFVLLAFLAIHPVPAAAQSTIAYSALFTPHLGVTAGDDVDGAGFTVGASLAVVQFDGWGAEIDVAHAVSIDGAGVESSGLTSGMLNLIYVWKKAAIQPFGVAGLGALRLSAARSPDGGLTTRTDFGLMFGGGVHAPITELVGVRADVRYLRFLDDRPNVPAASGVFGTWRIAAGVTLNWPLEP